MDKNIVITLLIFGLVTLVQAISSAARRKNAQQEDNHSSEDGADQHQTLREIFESLSSGEPVSRDTVSDKDELPSRSYLEQTPPEENSSSSSLVREFEACRTGGFLKSTSSFDGKDSIIPASSLLDDVSVCQSGQCEIEQNNELLGDFNLRDAVLYSEIINRRRF